MPDFFRSGDDGAILDGFAVWSRGVTYTVRHEMLSPLRRGQEYRISATVRRRIAKGEVFTAYGELYQRSSAIINARVTRLTRWYEKAGLQGRDALSSHQRTHSKVQKETGYEKA